MRRLLSSLALPAGAVALALSLSGCYARARVAAEPAYVEARYVPARIEVYPHDYYEGRVVYLVDGRWYTRDRGRWVYYRTAPPALERRRAYVERAPVAPERRRHRERDRERAHDRRDDRRDYRDDRRDPDHDRDRRDRDQRDYRSAPPARTRD